MRILTLLSPALLVAAAWFGGGVARAGSVSPILRIVGQADVTGRDIMGTEIPLGGGQFTLDLTVPVPSKPPDGGGGAGQDDFSSAFFNFNLDAEANGFPRGGQTIQNFITAGREGEPDADFFNFGVFDCSTTACSFPIGSINNSEALGFEGMFGFVVFPDGALGAESFSNLNAFLSVLGTLNVGTATETFFNVTYVPESLLGSGGGSGIGEPDIRFVSVDGTISDIIYPYVEQIGLPGDYNGDGTVDAADYTVFRDNLGTDFNLNGNGDETGGSAGIVDQADYDLWVAQFGETAGSGAANLAPGDSPGANYAVPEPASVIPAAIVLFSGILIANRAARH